MAIDRPGGEAIEQQRAADAPPPPPPPDTPGAEGFPSRAESKAFAASTADKSRQREDTGDTPDTASAGDATGEEQDAPRVDRAQEAEAPERSEPEARENGAADSPYDTDHDLGDDREEQPSGPENASPTGIVDDERSSVDTAAQTESVDRHPLYDEGTDVGEQSIPIDAAAELADERRPDGSGPPSEVPGAESGEVPPQVESDTPTDVVAAADTGQASNTADVRQVAETSDESLGGGLDTADRPRNGEQSAADASAITTSSDVTDIQTPGPGRQADVDGQALDGVTPAAEASPGTVADATDPPGPSESAGEASADDEGSTDINVAPADDADAGFPRPDGPHDDAVEPSPQDGAEEVEDSATENRRTASPDADQAMATGEHPAPPDTEDVAPPPDLPTGEELLKMEGDETSKFDKFRKALVETGPDIIDEIRQDTDTIDKILTRDPPAGHPEIKTAPDHPVMVPQGYDKAGAGDLATGVFVAGLVLGQGISWILDRAESRRGRQS